MNISKKTLFLSIFTLFQVIAPETVYAQRTSVVVVDRTDSVSDAIVGLGFCLGYGISGIVKHCKNKKQYRKYIQTFRDMGYTKERAEIYAKMAMNHTGGLDAVIKSIDDEQAMILNKTSEQKMQEIQHKQTMEQMAYQQKLNLLTNLIIFLSGVLVIGIGFLFFRRK